MILSKLPHYVTMKRGTNNWLTSHVQCSIKKNSQEKRHTYGESLLGHSDQVQASGGLSGNDSSSLLM